MSAREHGATERSDARAEVVLVRQEEPNGCGVACLAMVTGQTYAAVRAEVDLVSQGAGESDLLRYLQPRGFWVRRWWGRVAPEMRAPLAIANDGAHWVVVVGDRVLDPARGERSLSDCTFDHRWIDLWRPTPASASARADETDPVRLAARVAELEAERDEALEQRDDARGALSMAEQGAAHLEAQLRRANALDALAAAEARAAELERARDEQRRALVREIRGVVDRLELPLVDRIVAVRRVLRAALAPSAGGDQ